MNVAWGLGGTHRNEFPLNPANTHGWLQPSSASHGSMAVSPVFGKAVVHSSAEVLGRGHRGIRTSTFE